MDDQSEGPPAPGNESSEPVVTYRYNAYRRLIRARRGTRKGSAVSTDTWNAVAGEFVIGGLPRGRDVTPTGEEQTPDG